MSTHFFMKYVLEDLHDRLIARIQQFSSMSDDALALAPAAIREDCISIPAHISNTASHRVSIAPCISYFSSQAAPAMHAKAHDVISRCLLYQATEGGGSEVFKSSKAGFGQCLSSSSKQAGQCLLPLLPLFSRLCFIKIIFQTRPFFVI